MSSSQSTEELKKTIEGLSLKVNPDYGKGRLRRRVLLRKKPGAVIAELEDNHHAFRIRLFHDNHSVTAVNGDALRYPNNTCPGSLDLLNRLLGVELGKGPKAFSDVTEARAFCTHLFDLACLAYTHASRVDSSQVYSSQDNATREYHAIVEDERDGIVKASVLVNNSILHRWDLKNNIIQNEGKMQGISPHTGFMRWVMQNLQGDEQEAAIVLAKAVFVAFSRRVDTSHVAGTQLVNGIMPKDICYTYRSPVMDTAYHLPDTVKDYSDNPQDMLKFIEIF